MAVREVGILSQRVANDLPCYAGSTACLRKQIGPPLAPARGSHCSSSTCQPYVGKSLVLREELYKATSTGDEQQLRSARAEEHAAELRRGRDDLRQRLVELGAEQHAAVLPQLEVPLHLPHTTEGRA